MGEDLARMLDRIPAEMKDRLTAEAMQRPGRQP
jgi:hypothetical protein